MSQESPRRGSAEAGSMGVESMTNPLLKEELKEEDCHD